MCRHLWFSQTACYALETSIRYTSANRIVGQIHADHAQVCRYTLFQHLLACDCCGEVGIEAVLLADVGITPWKLPVIARVSVIS